NNRYFLGKRPEVKLGESMGHELAVVRASALTIEQIINMFSIPSGILDPANAYEVFYIRAMIYLMFRGVPLAAIHQQETETFYYYLGHGNRVVRVSGPGGYDVRTRTRKLPLIEAALRKVGIPALEPSTRRMVTEGYGIIWSPVDGRVRLS